MITLYSARVCPYALRTRIALHEKQLAFRHVEVDLRNKPADFLSVSRYGKVPALIDDDVEVYESSIIDEYLEERYPEPRLMPQRAGERALARIWIDFADTRMMPASRRIAFGEDDADKRAAREEFEAHCAALADALGDRAPWFFGEQLTLVEVTYAPFFSRLERYAGLAIPESVVAWWRRISERPSYRAALGEHR